MTGNFLPMRPRFTIYILHITFYMSLLLTSCEENMPIIPPLGPQEVGERKVLVEEFTGVRCPNCPPGSAELESLQSLYGDNLVIVSIHASGSFAIPLDNSQYDFRTEAGEQVRNYLGQAFGYPSAVINRKLLPGRSTLQLNQAAWAGTIEEEVKSDPALALTISSTFDQDSRTLSATVRLLPNSTISESLNLSIILTEDNLLDPQLTPEGEVENYLHRHVFRTMLTRFDGDPLAKLSKGQVVEKTYLFTLPAEWKVEQCRLVAFVHQTGTTKYIWQVNTAPVLE